MKLLLLNIVFVCFCQAQQIGRFPFSVPIPAVSSCLSSTYDNTGSSADAGDARSFSFTFGTDAKAAITIHSLSNGKPSIVSVTVDGNEAAFVDSSYKAMAGGWYMSTFLYKYLTATTGSKTVACSLSISAGALALGCISATCVSDVVAGEKHSGKNLGEEFAISSATGKIPVLVMSWSTADVNPATCSTDGTLTWEQQSWGGLCSRKSGAESVTITPTLTQGDDGEGNYSDPDWCGIIFQFEP